MKKRILFIVVIIIAVISISVYFWYQKAVILAPQEISPTSTSSAPTTKVKNTTTANSVNDLVGNNNLDGIGLVWDREESAAKYIIFRSDSIDGPFSEIGFVNAGPDRRTNATDFTPDARTKILCYKVEARDAVGRTIRVYEPVCVPKWQE